MTAVIILGIIVLGALAFFRNRGRSSGSSSGLDERCEHYDRSEDECPGCGKEVKVCDNCHRAPFHDCPEGFRGTL